MVRGVVLPSSSTLYMMHGLDRHAAAPVQCPAPMLRCRRVGDDEIRPPAITRKEMGHRIRLIRQARRLTQREMAKLINAGQSKISDIERGLQWPLFEDLGTLALALNFSLDVLNAPGEFDLKACLRGG